MSDLPILELVTTLGCTIRVVPHPRIGHGPDFTEKYGPEVALVLRMEQLDDGRFAEVLLTPAERTELAAYLVAPVWNTLEEEEKEGT